MPDKDRVLASEDRRVFFYDYCLLSDDLLSSLQGKKVLLLQSDADEGTEPHRPCPEQLPRLSGLVL
jgi:hypothetical protein